MSDFQSERMRKIVRGFEPFDVTPPAGDGVYLSVKCPPPPGVRTKRGERKEKFTKLVKNTALLSRKLLKLGLVYYETYILGTLAVMCFKGISCVTFIIKNWIIV